MRIDEDDNIWVRQSWLDDAMRDPERARLGMVKPEWNGPSDATALGTAAHAGAEEMLTSGDDAAAMAAIAPCLDEELALPNMRWNKYDSRADLLKRATSCYQVWRDEILPLVPQPGAAEVEFRVPLYELPDGRTVGIEGTQDWVPTEVNALWDWKFPGRDYNQAAKQKSAIQPTIYSLAAVKGGLQSVTDFKYTYPMDFTYGIGITLQRGARAQVFTVRRDWGHAEFALQRIKGFVDLYLNFGVDSPWPINDDHFLCSDKWCPWWSICKGSTQTWKDGAVPVDLKVGK